MKRIAASLVGLSVAVVLVAPSAHAQERIAEPPSADALVAATNAMMQPADLPAALTSGMSKSDRRFTTGFFNPPGGQDPLPVCVSGPSYRTVSIPRDDAIGYLASYGGVYQYEYQYPSAEAAAAVWAKVGKQISTKCNGSFTEGDVRTTNTARRIPGMPGGAQGWGVNNSGNLNGYSAVHLIGDTVQLVSFMGGNRAVPAKARAAMPRLAATLADRWTNRSTLPLTQNATITKAEQTMVQPSDAPASLPVATGADGGWSSFRASQPASGPDVFCRGEAKIPAGAFTFQSVFGSGGDVLGIVGKGDVVQQVDAYASTDSAAAAWAKVTAATAKCNKTTPGSITGKKTYEANTNGVSSVSMNGVPGVWTNTLMTYPDIDKGYTVANYSLYLLVGDSIQEFTYGLTVKGLQQITIDRAAVDAMAQTVANRWLAP